MTSCVLGNGRPDSERAEPRHPGLGSQTDAACDGIGTRPGLHRGPGSKPPLASPR